MDAEEVLTDELRAEGFILPCVSRPLSDITLDAWSGRNEGRSATG